MENTEPEFRSPSHGVRTPDCDVIKMENTEYKIQKTRSLTLIVVLCFLQKPENRAVFIDFFGYN